MGAEHFRIIELIIRKRIKPLIMNWANAIGFMLLMILMLLVTYKDIIGLIR
jgi:membrane-associated protease RseP (regulator of RpoE activity)